MSIEHEQGTPDSHQQARVETQAIEWLAKLRRPRVSEAEQAEFAVWLGADPAHRQIFDELLEVWDLTGQLQDGATKARASGHWRWIAAAAIVLLTISFWSLAPHTDHYRTGTGEQIAIDLEDGSRLQLNTETTLQVELFDKLRHVDLLQGEVFFSVTRDPERPFEIKAGQTTIKVVGTSFNVRNIDGIVRVEVLKGIVEVDHETHATVRKLGATEGIEYVNGEELPLSVAANVTAPWREGKVIYQDVELGDLLTDLDRYLPGRLSLAQDDLAGIRVTAVLELEDRSAMLDALASSLNLEWSEVSEGLVLLSRG